MPMYDYQCDTNGEVIEVVHGMSVKFETWCELCEYTRRSLGDTPADAPVKRLMGGLNAITAPVTPSKTLKAQGEASKNTGASHVMAAPMRTSKF